MCKAFENKQPCPYHRVKQFAKCGDKNQDKMLLYDTCTVYILLHNCSIIPLIVLQCRVDGILYTQVKEPLWGSLLIRTHRVECWTLGALSWWYRVQILIPPGSPSKKRAGKCLSHCKMKLSIFLDPTTLKSQWIFLSEIRRIVHQKYYVLPCKVSFLDL